MMACFDSEEEIGYAICQIKYDGLGVLSPELPFLVNKIDTLNYMVRTDLARQVGGWIPFDVWSADFNLIDGISKVSKGRFVSEVLGWHRTLRVNISSESNLIAQKTGITYAQSKILLFKNLFLVALSRLINVKTYPNKSIKININRIIYDRLCRFT